MKAPAFLGLLICFTTALLTVLKATGAVAWPWWTVALPAAVPLGMLLVLVFSAALLDTFDLLR